MKKTRLFYSLILKMFLGSLIVICLAAFHNFADDNNYHSYYLYETVTDIDGNIYQTVKIGEQIWMTENLKVTRFRDDTPIPNISNYDDKWSDLSTGALCWYDDDPIKYKNTYGALYNFYAVADSRKIAPEGWHVPSADEWKELIEYLGGEETAGGKMKLQNPNYWNYTNSGADNSSGFSGIPAGGRGRFGDAGEGGNYATWWSSTSHDSLYAWHWGLYPAKWGIRFNPGHKTSGFSVRCIKD